MGTKGEDMDQVTNNRRTLSNNIGPKIAQLAKSKGFTQSQIAQKCGVSRITIQRFFNGKTEIRSGDLEKILNILNLDLSSDVDYLINSQRYQIPHSLTQVKGDLILLMESLSPEVRKTILDNICWWTETSDNDALQQSTQKLKSFVKNMEA